MELLIKAIQDHDILSLWGAIFSLLMIVFWHYPKYKHKRYLYNILILAFLLCTIGTFYFSGLVPVVITSILLILWAIYFFVAFYAATKPIFPETLTISQLTSLVREGRYTEIEKRFHQRPFYIRSISSISGRIEWDLLWAKRLIEQEQQRLRSAYEIYSDLLSLPLFEKEKNNIGLKQVLALFLLGDTNKAKSIFERTKQKIDQDKYFEILYLQSLFDERAGEFEKARRSLLSAVGEHDNVKEQNWGRANNVYPIRV